MAETFDTSGNIKKSTNMVKAVKTSQANIYSNNNGNIVVKKENGYSSYGGKTSPILVIKPNQNEMTNYKKIEMQDEYEDELLMNMNTEAFNCNVKNQTSRNTRSKTPTTVLNQSNTNGTSNNNFNNLKNVTKQQENNDDEDDDFLMANIKNFEKNAKLNIKGNCTSLQMNSKNGFSENKPSNVNNTNNNLYSKRPLSTNSNLDKQFKTNQNIKKVRTEEAKNINENPYKNYYGSKSKADDDDDDDLIYCIDIDENYNLFSGKMVKNQEIEPNKAFASKDLVPPLALADLANPNFVIKCCQKNFDPDNGLSTCSHTVDNCYVLTLSGGILQFKLKWYQECIVGGGKNSMLENVYISDGPMSKLLDMTCKEAKVI